MGRFCFITDDHKTENMPINEWSMDDRPREKLRNKGRLSLSNAELIAILIGSGSKNESALQLAQRILNSASNNLQALGQLSIEDLMKFKGIGEAKAIAIASALELGRRRQSISTDDKIKINSSKAAFEMVLPYLADLNHEAFVMIGLNRATFPLGVKVVSSGGMTETLVDARIIFKMALEMNATCMILAHNHPSGNLQPSAADISITKKLIDAGKMMHISVLDHLIIGHNNYFSMADEGLVDF